MPALRPFRDYDEHNVINLYKFSGTIPVNRGTLVQVEGDGWKSDAEPIDMLGAVGNSYDNTVSQRYGVNAAVKVAGLAATPLGILLHDVKEEDENGEKLVFNPRKAAEMEVALSGQAVPVCTKGVFLYSGATLAAQTPVGGTAIYGAANGEISTGSAGSAVQVGKALGAKDADGVVLIKLDL